VIGETEGGGKAVGTYEQSYDAEGPVPSDHYCNGHVEALGAELAPRPSGLPQLDMTGLPATDSRWPMEWQTQGLGTPVDDEPLPFIDMGYARRASRGGSRPGTRERTGSRSGTRERGGSRPGTRERPSGSRPSSRASDGSRRSGSEMSVTGGDSFRLNMPSFRLLWNTGGTHTDATLPGAEYDNVNGDGHSDQDMGRDARRRRGLRSSQTRDRLSRDRQTRDRRDPGQKAFFGPESRAEFFELYAEQKRIWQVEGLPGAEGQRSARTHYLGQCERMGVCPVPLLIDADRRRPTNGVRSEKPTDVVHLNSFRIGNKAAVAYSVRPRPRRLSALSILHSKSVLYGAFVWACRALNSQKMAASGPGSLRLPA
jgi:hypothetical protein